MQERHRPGVLRGGHVQATVALARRAVALRPREQRDPAVAQRDQVPQRVGDAAARWSEWT